MSTMTEPAPRTRRNRQGRLYSGASEDPCADLSGGGCESYVDSGFSASERLWVLVLGKDPKYEADINGTRRVIICAEIYMACAGYWS
jgi:hypothetical protein